MPADVQLTPAMEDYLETILRQVYDHRVARSRDIAHSLGVHKSTVTAALKSLAAAGFIHYAPYEAITLTAEGERAARDVWRRHEALRRFFIDVLGIEPEAAEKAACAMEHAASREVVSRMAMFGDFLNACPRAGADWLANLRDRCENGRKSELCAECAETCLTELRRRSEGESVGMTVTLNEMKPGQSGRVTAVTGVPAIRRRVTEMGLVPGAPLELERVAPMGDPLDIRVKGYRLSLRKDEAAGITVELSIGGSK